MLSDGDGVVDLYFGTLSKRDGMWFLIFEHFLILKEALEWKYIVIFFDATALIHVPGHRNFVTKIKVDSMF